MDIVPKCGVPNWIFGVPKGVPNWTCIEVDFLGHLKNIHLHSCKHKTVKLKLTLTLTLTDTGGAVLTLMLGYRRLKNYKLKRKIQKLRLRKYRDVYS